MRDLIVKKHFIAIVSVIMSLSVVSCSEKETTAVSNQLDLQSKSINYDDLPFYINGCKGVDYSTLDTANSVSIVTDSCIYFFDDDEAFKTFCVNNNLLLLYTDNQKLDSIYEKAKHLGILDSEYLSVEDVPFEMKSYWKSIVGCEFGTVPGQQNEAKISWAITFYDGITWNGDSKTCFGPTYWSLGSFNKKASSFKVVNTGIGGVWLCHKKWYGKPRSGYFIVGLPIGEVFLPCKSSDNNKTCSYCTTLH